MTLPRRIASENIPLIFTNKMTSNDAMQADQVLATLHELMQASESDTIRDRFGKKPSARLFPEA